MLACHDRQTSRSRRQWLAGSGGALDGVIAKRLDAALSASGERDDDQGQAAPHGRLRRRAAYRARPRRAEVSPRCCSGSTTPTAGSTMSASPRRINDRGAQAALGEIVQALSSAALGFTGDTHRAGPAAGTTVRENALGAAARPSWSPRSLYDQVTDGRFRHGTRLSCAGGLTRRPRQCTIEASWSARCGPPNWAR
jgi:hypothetical protein